MLIKSVILFLLAMVVIGMVGNLLFPGAMGRSLRRRVPPKVTLCRHCGQVITGKPGCACGKG